MKHWKNGIINSAITAYSAPVPEFKSLKSCGGKLREVRWKENQIKKAKFKMQNYPFDKLRAGKSKFKIIFLLVIFTFSFLIFNLRTATAQVMRSENFVLQGGNFNMTSGNKESQNFKLSDVVGQVAAGVFTSKGFIINAGFLNGAAGTFLNFSVSPTLADFGQLTPETPVTRDLTIKIENGNYPGYIVRASQNQPLMTTVGAEIADTACDYSDNPCTKAQGSLWQNVTTYGFGYRMEGRTVPDDFTKDNYFRPFPATRRSEIPVIVMQSQAKKVTDTSVMHLKLNVSKNQPVGQYRNVISFTAIAGI